MSKVCLPFTKQTDLIGSILKLEAKSDSLEAVSLKGSATDKTTVDIRASEKLLSVSRVARTAIED